MGVPALNSFDIGPFGTPKSDMERTWWYFFEDDADDDDKADTVDDVLDVPDVNTAEALLDDDTEEVEAPNVEASSDWVLWAWLDAKEDIWELSMESSIVWLLLPFCMLVLLFEIVEYPESGDVKSCGSPNNSNSSSLFSIESNNAADFDGWWFSFPSDDLGLLLFALWLFLKLRLSSLIWFKLPQLSGFLVNILSDIICRFISGSLGIVLNNGGVRE